MIDMWISDGKCTGCAACSNVCPTNSIKMEMKTNGFVSPVIIKTCINCGKCREVCERRIDLIDNRHRKKYERKAYLAWSNDEGNRFESTSGGIFTEIARFVLRDNGVVFGARYDEKLDVNHSVIENEQDLIILKQSKYVQSNINNTFSLVKKYLDSGKKVLFCGTPCQIVGLYAFLGKDKYENLQTVDFICMGVNSPLAYKKWIQGLHIPVKGIWFKYKKYGWKKSPRVTKVLCEDEEIVISGNDNTYMKAFLEARCIIRRSCASCDFKSDKRLSDITLGDFWGVDNAYDDDKGTSAVIINTEKGEGLFEAIKKSITFKSVGLEEIKKGNYHYDNAVVIPDNSEDFIKLLKENEFDVALGKFKYEV
ncbi:Coenzyme F420-reducing hydrogenase, beta subunit [Pseudobutyrivibrio sp. C4]|uniref:Coenzyme F420 hydrogenase/dehydrogenase, beta subunit C-terminal domain n=1 Tax=Pseudobutyrivibrio sp. C4 TaxID=1520803 RepID=UPI0008AE7191|nr:Coenzyme F420 hydrogenase/dehydrogenase, beta subunit C-terminal domain [Pseudobutyrivibrio sp. C4]SET12728.1 Coenzyme F420-reducing hydrogenase, beta subunit [Pseudobutyrivibrio sp. C4]